MGLGNHVTVPIPSRPKRGRERERQSRPFLNSVDKVT